MFSIQDLLALLGPQEKTEMPQMPGSPFGKPAQPTIGARQPSGAGADAFIGAPRGPQALRHNHPEATIGARSVSGVGGPNATIGASRTRPAATSVDATGGPSLPPDLMEALLTQNLGKSPSVNSLKGSGFGSKLTPYERANLSIPDMPESPMAGMMPEGLPEIEAPEEEMAAPSPSSNHMTLKRPTMFSEPEGALPSVPDFDDEDSGVGLVQGGDVDLSGMDAGDDEDKLILPEEPYDLPISEMMGQTPIKTPKVESPFGRMAMSTRFKDVNPDVSGSPGLVDGDDNVVNAIHAAMRGAKGASGGAHKVPVPPTGEFGGNPQSSVIPQMPGEMGDLYAGERPDEVLEAGPELNELPEMTGGKQFKGPNGNLFKSLMGRMF